MTCPSLAQLASYAVESAPGASSGIAEHLRDCERCALAVEILKSGTTVSNPRADAPAAFPAEQGSRYTMLERLGAGAMGEVFTAWDSRLERRVALKVVRGGGGGEGAQALLVKEAQALARLQHPNVVSVFDVDRHDGQLFISMEYVEGTTLRGCFHEKRPAKELLQLCLQAARGLQAAHAAGVIHRDFKPDNVLVGRDGVARVSDFGIARAAAPEASSDATPLQQSTIAGTPAYMAPEQMVPGPIDARADQFAFCATLFEALTGELPFAEPNLDKRRELFRSGAVPPAADKLPRWLRPAVLRGLSFDPARRFDSIGALVSVLSASPERTRRRVVLAGAVVLGLVGLGSLGATLATARANRCSASQGRIASTWNADRRARVQAGLANADDERLGSRVAERLDAWASDWSRAHRDICEATRVVGDQPEALMFARFDCLEGRRREMGSLITLLEGASTATANKAIDAVDALSTVEDCRAAQASTARHQARPAEPAGRDRIDSLEARVANLRALALTAQYAELEREIAAVLPEVQGAHHPRLASNLALAQATLAGNQGKGNEAIDAFGLAATQAMALSDDGQAQIALCGLAEQARRTGRYAEATLAIRLGEALLTRNALPTAAGLCLLSARGSLLFAQRRLAEAEQPLLEVVRATEPGGVRADGARVSALVNLVLVTSEREDTARALEYARMTIQTAQRAYGPRAPTTVWASVTLAQALSRGGQPEAAIDYFLAAREPTNRLFGPESSRAADLALSLGFAYSAVGRRAEARAEFERAARLYARQNPIDESRARLNLGDLLREMGEFDAAEVELREAVRMREKALGVADKLTVGTRATLALTLSQRGKCAEAVELQRSVVASFASSSDPRLPEEKLNLAASLVCVGNAREALGLAEEVLRTVPAEQAMSDGRGVALLRRAQALNALRRHGEACAALDEARKLIPDTPIFELQWNTLVLAAAECATGPVDGAAAARAAVARLERSAMAAADGTLARARNLWARWSATP